MPDRCKACDHPRPDHGRPSTLTTTVAAMAHRSEQGCIPCSVIMKTLAVYFQGSGEEIPDAHSTVRLYFNVSAVTKRSLEMKIVAVKKWAPDNTGSLRVSRLSLYSVKSTPWLSRIIPDLPIGNEVPRSTCSTESLEWVVQQIQGCSDRHRSCRTSDESPLPSRVLDLEAGCKSRVRLHDSRGETARYICLSHCWGGRPFLRTLSSTLDSYMENIPFAWLPLTFQQAIDFTRKLGIRYLWIDSLCIIQDDVDDWQAEASRMASIFQNCFLVISAAKSSNAYEGLYSDFPSRCNTHIVHFTAESTEDGSTSQETICVRQPLTHSRRSLWPYAPQDTPLPVFARGWILQERFLAPRVLHFGPEELSWECLEATSCQCTAVDDRDHIEFSNPEVKYKTPRTGPPKSLTKSDYSPVAWKSMSAAKLETSWYRLVEEYTRLHLTYEKDIFPALAGFARVMQSTTNWEYVAGLWRGSLPRGLLWIVENPSNKMVTTKAWPDRSKSWRAPSWSWASVNCPVKFNVNEIDIHDKMEVYCEILEVQCEMAGPDSTGELLPGGSHLIIQGSAITARLRFSDTEEAVKAPLPFNIVELDILEGYMKNFWVDDDCRDVVPPSVADDDRWAHVLCLFVGKDTVTEELTFLVIAPAGGTLAHVGHRHGENKLTYRRIGLVGVFGGPPGSPRQGWASKLLEQGTQTAVKLV
ncbi:HET-domain-containing protein [Coniochaeta sp. PMI_546]|nr:HET-domain-containing protein [Coniochaeta sp. PMI_546]